MNQEKAGLIDAFSQRHPNVVKNTIRFVGAAGLTVGAIYGGAKLEEKSIQEALADNDRQPICHSGNGKNWNIIRPNENSYDAHLKDWEGPAQGHDHDYFASDSNGDGNIDKEDCGFVAPTPTEVFTPVPTLTPELTATYMPSPTVIFTPTETRPTPTGTQPTATEVIPSPTGTQPTPTSTEIKPTSTLATSPTAEKTSVCPTCAACPTSESGVTAEVCNPCEPLETIAAALAQKVGPEQTMAAAQSTLAAIESTRITNEQTSQAERTSTPNGLTSNQPEISEASQEKNSPLKSNVLAGAGVTLVGFGALGAAEVIRRKKKS